jgi:hypothetical protein
MTVSSPVDRAGSVCLNRFPGGLLRTRCKRPRDCRTADTRNELAPSLEQVALRQSSLESARASRARVRAAIQVNAAQRRCGDRDGLSHVGALARHRGSGCVFGLPYCIGCVELGGWNNGRPNDHARLYQVSDPDPGSTAGNDDTGFHSRRSWCECDERAGYQSGRAQYRPATSDDRASDLHATRRHHGSVRQ